MPNNKCSELEKNLSIKETEKENFTSIYLTGFPNCARLVLRPRKRQNYRKQKLR